MKYLVCVLFLVACGGDPPSVQRSTTLALGRDGLWAVNPDADSVSLVDPTSRSRLAEIALGERASVESGDEPGDPRGGRFEPRVQPRALALSPDEHTLWVVGERSGKLYAIDTAARSLAATIDVGVGPTAVVTDGRRVYVVCSLSATLVAVDARSHEVVATREVGDMPFGAALSGQRLFVSTFLEGAGVVTLDRDSLEIRSRLSLAEVEPGADKRLPNGVPRGVYTISPQPTTGALWLPHIMLAVKTAQPALDFESTVFPTVTVLSADGSREDQQLTFVPKGVPGARGAFDDSVSGPRDIAFTPDGKLALVALQNSEDLLVFDALSGHQLALVRPLPATMLDGVVVAGDGKHAYVNGRNSHNVVVLAIDPMDAIAPVTVDGPAIDLLERDPMPPELRLGQRLFYTANSAAFPITKNFWVACASCHLEGGTDAVTWLFAQGPRDTPSNAGGMATTGFLQRQATRVGVDEYDETINVEQGGSFHRDAPAQRPLLDALTAYVNRAIPLPPNPHLAPTGLSESQAAGKATFEERCTSCHSGPQLTDSGAGNPRLERTGEVLLHDIGTCVKGGVFPDRPALDTVTGALRDACLFDTPSLRGVFATPPYFHDGSAATLHDVVDRLPQSASLSPKAKADLVEYLLTL